MEKAIVFNGVVIPYMVSLSARAKHMRIVVKAGGVVAVVVPARMKERNIESFVMSKGRWLVGAVEKLRHVPVPRKKADTKKEYIVHKDIAYERVMKLIAKCNAHYNFSFGKVSVKNQKTLWGSCSRRGNLNFNYKIVLLSEKLAEYIVVHELCHLKEFNHSKNFWSLVEQTIPNHKSLRVELKKSGTIF